MNDRDKMRELQALDEATEWELSGELLADGEGDDYSLATVPFAELDSEDDEIANICDCVAGMNEAGELTDIIVIVNTTDDDMILFTNLERNDIIMGRLSVAPLNWWQTQRKLQQEQEGGD